MCSTIRRRCSKRPAKFCLKSNAGLVESTVQGVPLTFTFDSLTSSLDPYEASETAMALESIQLHSPLARAAVDRCESEQHIYCKPSRYRTADGSCNNLRYPTWGKSFTCFQRLLPPAYSDGQSAPRVSTTGYPLPNPRVLSAVIHKGSVFFTIYLC